MTKRQKYPKKFLAQLKLVKGKRSLTVINHILKRGFITTEDLEKTYGYNHPPRAIRDVREQGIPIETFSVKNSEGRTIAAYRFGDPSLVRRGTIGGRKVFSKSLKQELVNAQNSRCAICTEDYEERYLQFDHRVPYEVAGDVAIGKEDVTDFMLLCGSCNRAKSWSCEHCLNWLEIKNPEICLTCYWGNPESYKHIALRDIRRLDVIWTEEEVKQYDELKRQAELLQEPLPEYVKRILNKRLEKEL